MADRRPASLMPRWVVWCGGAVVLLVSLAIAGYHIGTRVNPGRLHAPGDVIDTFNGVAVYYNGGVNHVAGRHLAADGYNLGMRYQCVEFVKRYYYQRFGHRMPDTYGNARDFFDPALAQGALSPRRGLLQFHNGGNAPPRVDDLLVFGPSVLNPYGHVAIVASVGDAVGFVQQNPGPFGGSRSQLAMHRERDAFRVDGRVVGWLRRPEPQVNAPADVQSVIQAVSGV